MYKVRERREIERKKKKRNKEKKKWTGVCHRDGPCCVPRRFFPYYETATLNCAM